jgi:hypothetical protein
MTRAPSQAGDDWYASEESTRVALIAELQRIKRRTWVRPVPVLVLAAAVTGFIMYKVANKTIMVQAEVVLALTEGVMSGPQNSLPVDQLREYVSSVLLPDGKLIDLIEKRDLSRLRKRLGPQFAIEELRSSLEIQIWKNSFMYQDEDDNARHSARIALAVTDSDPDHALGIARDLATIVMDTAAARRRKLADTITLQVQALTDATEQKLDGLSNELVQKQAAIDDALKRHRPDVVGILQIDRVALEKERAITEDQLARIAASPESLAGEIAAAGLDMSLTIVEEHRPERPTHSGFVLIMVGVVVGTGVLVGAATLLGAFDSRVHDTDDVARLGLPVLGHIPGFAGDNVGSMQSRGALRARVPSFLRWRSHR